MNPKEKAKELFNKMHKVEDEFGVCGMIKSDAKQCALICVDLLFETCESLNVRYWQDVKQEIIKL